jgi:arsenite methyltransferase
MARNCDHSATVLLPLDEGGPTSALRRPVPTGCRWHGWIRSTAQGLVRHARCDRCGWRLRSQRAATLRALALQAGERVVDVGSGPGLLAGEMATQVGPAGRVVGLDLSDPMLALSRQRCRDPVTSKCVSFLQADAARLPFGDGRFDVAVSTQVYEYVADVAAAYRVLRPGGRVLILDTDWDSIVWAAGDPARMRRILDAWADRFADPHLPRSLSWQLQGAGFKLERREVLVLFNPEYDPDSYSVANGQIMADFAVTQGRMPPEEAEADTWDCWLLPRSQDDQRSRAKG